MFSFSKNKNKGFGRYVSEFDMGLMDFERIHGLLLKVDYCAIMTRMEGAYIHIKAWHSILYQVYIILRECALPPTQEAMDKIFLELSEDIEFYGMHRTNLKMREDIRNRLNTLNMDVYELRDYAGLSFPKQKKQSDKKKIEEAI